MFVGAHVALSMVTKTPELMISEQEGKSFMTAAQQVMRHYSVETTQKTLDWIALCGCAATIYGTRALAIAARQAAEKAARGQPSGKVVNLRPVDGAPAAPVINPDPMGEEYH